MKADKSKIKVAIIGAGFGGVSAAKKLASNKNIEIFILDRRNHHLFQPLLYQVAMAGLNPSEIATPIRKVFSKNKNVQVTLTEVEKINVKQSSVLYDGSWKIFDYIIVACGAKHSYFGNNEWENIAPGLKNIEQATEIRRRILTAFELAEKQEDRDLQDSYLSFAVVGGGPTGVELAGAIIEMAKMTLKHDYKRVDLSRTKVYLIEAGNRLLAGFPKDLSKRAEKDLLKMGVEVIKDSRAAKLSPDGLYAGDRWIAAKTIIWAAGVSPSSLVNTMQCEKDSGGRILVEKDLSLPNHPNIFAVGDIVSFQAPSGDFLPGIAPVAIQQGGFAAEQIQADLKQRKRKSFQYLDKGIMATIGRTRAVVSTAGMHFTGLFAWLIWVFVHIVYLMRFKNRVFVFFQWVFAYFKFGQGARLIVHKTWRFYGDKKIQYDIEDTK
tara:strand:+ start:884 stop:2191 length:1308 start_codon:yes stop_codon:yes gene_type:complete